MAADPAHHLRRNNRHHYLADGDHHISSCLVQLPDEIILRVLYYLDVNDLFASSRTCRLLRSLSTDPLLHYERVRYCFSRVAHLLPRRPQLHTLQPPIGTIYLTQTHLAATKLHRSLVGIRLSRSLARRPNLSTLVSKNIVPKECCKKDRMSGEIVFGTGLAGGLVERKRRVEREAIKDGLRVWLDRKASQIRARKKDGGVGILVWRFSRRLKFAEGRWDHAQSTHNGTSTDNVSRLRRLFEGTNGRRSSLRDGS